MCSINILGMRDSRREGPMEERHTRWAQGPESQGPWGKGQGHPRQQENQGTSGHGGSSLLARMWGVWMRTERNQVEKDGGGCRWGLECQIWELGCCATDQGKAGLPPEASLASVPHASQPPSPSPELFPAFLALKVVLASGLSSVTCCPWLRGLAIPKWLRLLFPASFP